jgi:Flp pilus assembly protein TadG
MSGPHTTSRKRAGRAAGRSFWRDRRGLAAIEFAFIAPVMIVLFFGVVEGSNALSVSRRVTQATNTLADLASQETELTPAQLDDLFSGVTQIIGEGAVSIDIRLASIAYDAVDDRIEVRWSRDNLGAQPYAPDTEYTRLSNASVLDAGASLIVAEVRFNWTPTLTSVIIPGVAFDKFSMRWPRRAARVQFCVAPGSCVS